MGMIVSKIVSWGGESSVLCCRIALYTTADVLPYKEFQTIKKDELHLQITIFNTIIPKVIVKCFLLSRAMPNNFFLISFLSAERS